MAARDKKLKLSDELDLWEMQPGETAQPFEAFVAYRDMGPYRSHAKVGQKLGKSREITSVWSRCNHWVKRVLAWDAHLDEQTRADEIKAVRDMKKRHVKIAMQGQEVASYEIRRLLSRVAKSRGGRLDESLDILEARKLLDTCIRLERLARGEPETVTEDVGTGKLTWADLKALRHARRQNEHRDD